MPQIHPTAIVAPGAMLAETVVIGPYCIIGEDVSLGPRVTLRSNVVVDGRTSIGEGTRLFPFASIGLEPQDPVGVKLKSRAPGLALSSLLCLSMSSPTALFAKSSK